MANRREIVPHQFRYVVVKHLEKVLAEWKKDIKGCQQRTLAIIEQFKDADDDFSLGMTENLKRQQLVSLEKAKYMQKWGKHQYRQLLRSLNMQIKTNFRDYSLDNFGGELFNQVSDDADDIYNSMDPPKPSLSELLNKQAPLVQSAQQFAALLNQQRIQAAPQDNAQAAVESDNDDRYGGCFAGECTVRMRDGSNKLVKNLEKGDQIATLCTGGRVGFATLKCLLKFVIPTQRKRLCRFDGGLIVTPGHPVFQENTWVFPREIVNPQSFECEAVYNMIVDEHHIAIVNGIPLILPGHGF